MSTFVHTVFIPVAGMIFASLVRTRWTVHVQLALSLALFILCTRSLSAQGATHRLIEDAIRTNVLFGVVS